MWLLSSVIIKSSNWRPPIKRPGLSSLKTSLILEYFWNLVFTSNTFGWGWNGPQSHDRLLTNMCYCSQLYNNDFHMGTKFCWAHNSQKVLKIPQVYIFGSVSHLSFVLSSVWKVHTILNCINFWHTIIIIM